MKCKFCKKALEEGVVICPDCGKSQEGPSKGAKIAVAAVAGLLLVSLLAWLVLWGMGIKWSTVTAFCGFTDATYSYKNSYTVSDKKMEKKKAVEIAKLGDQVLTNEDLQIYYWLCVQDYQSTYGYYVDIDWALPLEDQVYDVASGMTWQQYFLQSALETWKRYAVIVQLAENAGYELREDLLAEYTAEVEESRSLALQAGYPDIETFVDIAISKGSSWDAYLRYCYQQYMALGYLDSIEDELVPTAEEIEAYYAANATTMVAKGYGKEAGKYYSVRHILIEIEGDPIKNEEGEIVYNENKCPTYTEEQWAACREKAQALLDEFLADDPTEEKFAELAKTNSKDPGSASKGGLYEGMTKDYFGNETFDNWYADESRQPGDTGLVQNTVSSVQGYHIMYFCESFPIWEYHAKQMAFSEKANKLIGDAEEMYPVEINFKKIVIGYADMSQ